MKNSPVTTILLGLLAASAVVSFILCMLYNKSQGEFRQLQAQAIFINQRNALIQQLAMDAVEYSKKNPEIDPLLQAAGLKPKPGQPAAAPKSGK